MLYSNHRKNLSKNHFSSKYRKGKTYIEIYGEEKTKEYKEKLFTFYDKYHRMPSYNEAAKLFSVKSKDTAYRIIAGFIKEDILSILWGDLTLLKEQP